MGILLMAGGERERVIDGGRERGWVGEQHIVV